MMKEKHLFVWIVLCLMLWPLWALAQDETETIHFANGSVKSLCVSQWDTDGDDELSYDEAAAVTDLGTSFAGTSIKRFDELQYFTSLTEIPSGAFKACKELQSVTLPSSVKTIGSSAFHTCYKLTSFDFNEVETIGASAFYSCIRLASVDLPKSVVSVGSKAFYYNKALETVTVHSPSAVIDPTAFASCSVLSEMTMPAVMERTFVPASVGNVRLVYEPESEYATFCSANPIDFSQTEDVTAYTVTGYLEGEVYLMEVSDVPAGTGVVVKAAPGTVHELSLGSGAALEVPNLLVGVDVATEVAASSDGKAHLVLSSSEESALFTALTESAEIGAHEAYLRLPADMVSAGESYPVTVSDRVPVEVIAFADANVKSLCVSQWDTDGDGELSYDEAAAVTDLGTSFAGTNIKRFDELQYFTSLTEIPSGAFKACKELQSLTLPSSVKTIGSSAFQTCYKLTSFDFNEVEAIGASAFYSCIHLAFVDLPKSVVSVGSKAFYYNKDLASVTVHSPSAVIDPTAFASCNALSEVTMPAVMERTFVPASVGNVLLVYEPESEYATFCSANPIDFSQTEDVTAYTVTGYLEGEVYLMEVSDVPAGTGVVVKAAPGTVYELSLGSGAALEVPNLLVGVDVATEVAASSEDMVHLVLSSSEESALFTALTESAEIGAHEAYLRLPMEDVSAGESYPVTVSDRLPVKVINFAYANVKSLCVSQWDTDGDGELSYDEAAAVTDLGTSFAGTSIKSFDELQYFTSLTEIPSGAFKACKELQSLTLPSSVKTIGSSAFQTCYKLTSFDFNEVESIGASAFYSCIRLASVDLPKSVVSVGSKAFYYNKALETVTVHSPSAVIDPTAFASCNALSEVTMPAVMERTFVPASVGNVLLVYEPESEYATFCSANPIDFSQTEDVTAYTVTGYLEGEVYLMEVSDVPAGTGVVVKAAPGTVYELSLGSGAALEVPNLLVGVDVATEVAASSDGKAHLVLSSSEESALFTALTESAEIGAHEAYLRLPMEDVSAGESYPVTVSDRVPVKVIHFADNSVKSLCVSQWDTDGDGELSYDEAAAVTDLGTSFAGTSIKRFDELQYFTSLTEIPSGAFKACKELQSLTLPSSVKTIGSSAFQTCYKLTSFDFNEVETIGASAFYSCIRLASVDLPKSVVSVGSKAFYYNKALETVTVHSPSAVIDPTAFASCSALSEVTMPAVMERTFVPASVGNVRLVYEPESEYSTFCSANPIDFSQTEDVTAYTVTGYLEGEVYLMEVSDVPAGAGVVVKAAPGTVYELSLGSGAALEVPNLLVGVDVATEVAASSDGKAHLVLSSSEESALFTALTESAEIGAHEAYLRLPADKVNAGESYPVTVSDRLPVEVIHFADNSVKSLCVSQWDTDGDGELSYDEAAAVTDLGTSFAGTNIKSFDELQYFTSLTEIPSGAFKDCSLFASVVLPQSVNAIGNEAFQNTAFENFTFDGLENIGTGAFSGCPNLASLDFPEGVQNIGAKAFSDCSSLASVIVRSSNIIVADDVFDNCANLAAVSLPATLASTFVPANVDNVRLTYAPESLYSTFYSPNSIDFSQTEDVTAYTVTGFLDGEVYLMEVSDVPAGTGVVVKAAPGTVYELSLGSGTPLEVPALLVGVDVVTEVPASSEDMVHLVLTSSEESALFTALTESAEIGAHEAYLRLPMEDVSAGETYPVTVSDRVPVKVIDFADANVKSLCVSQWDTDGDGELSYDEAAAVTDLGTSFAGTNIKRFDELQYFTSLTEIPSGAFKACKELLSLTLPSSVKTIGSSAFHTCYKLASFDFNEVETISANAFYSCIVLASVDLPESVVSVGSKAFYYNKALETVTVHSPSAVIDPTAFASCSALSEVTMPAVLAKTFVPASVSSLHLTYSAENLYSTFYSPNPIDFSQTEDVTAYTVTGYLEGEVYLMEVSDVPAEIGVVVKAAPGTVYELSLGSGTPLEVPALLVGVDVVTEVPASSEDMVHLVLSSSEESALFTALTESAEIGAHEAYLRLPMEDVSAGESYPVTVSDRVPVKVIHFADNSVKSLCVSQWDTDGDGELSYDEAAAVTDLGTSFAGTNIKRFDELQYFTSLTEIPSGAFKACKELQSLTLPSSVKTIGSSAFHTCYKLTSFDFNEVEAIDASAFYSCIHLASVDLPKSVVSVGSKAFYYNKDLASVTIHSPSVVIDPTAFASCSVLSEVTMPAVMERTFVPASVSSLRLVYEPESEYSTFCSANPIDFSQTEGLTAYVVPVLQSGTAYLKEVADVPAATGVVVVGTPGVEYVVNLGSNTPIEENNLLVGVMDNTMVEPQVDENTNLILAAAEESFTFDVISSTTEIKAHEAYLQVDKNRVGEMTSFQLAIVDNLPSENIIFVDANVKAVCVSKWDTNSDGELNYEEAAAVSSLEKIFKENKRIGQFPELKYFTGLTEISDSAFASSSLKSVIVPQNVERIGIGAFYSCYSLISVELPQGLTTIASAAFSACTSLPKIELPETALDLGNRAFYFCSRLTSINLPEGLKAIPNAFLRSCSSLDSISVPASVESVGDLAFSGCSKLKAVRMPVNLVINSLPSTVERFYYYYTLSEEWSTFCSPNALGFSTTENAQAYVATSYEEGTVLLTRADAVPANTGIVLHGTPGEEIIFSKGTDEAPVNLLRGILKPTLVVPSTFTETHFVLGMDNLKGLAFYPLKDDAVLDAYTAYLVLPGIIGNELIHISLGDNIIFADNTVKALCVSHWDTNGDGELSVAEAASVTSLGTVFTSNTTIKTFEELKFFTGLTEISENAFSGCTALKSIIIPENVTVFSDNAFKNCRNLTAINVPENLTAIGSNCFNNCSLLESIVIPETVTSVGSNAFLRCNKLVSVTVPARLYVNSFPTSVTNYTFTLTLNEEYETFCSGYNLNFANTGGLQAFTTPLYNNGRIKMSRQNNVPANTGVLLHGVVGKQYLMTLGTAATLDNLYVGVLNETALSPFMDDKRVFCLMDGSQGYAFYPISEETTLESNRAYLPLPVSDVENVNYILMSLLPDIDDPVIRAPQRREGIAASIGNIEEEGMDEWFTLTGVKLNGKPTQRGVYIHNGKKVSVK